VNPVCLTFGDVAPKSGGSVRGVGVEKPDRLSGIAQLVPVLLGEGEPSQVARTRRADLHQLIVSEPGLDAGCLAHGEERVGSRNGAQLRRAIVAKTDEVLADDAPEQLALPVPQQQVGPFAAI
jgi:hypothetical protein